VRAAGSCGLRSDLTTYATSLPLDPAPRPRGTVLSAMLMHEDWYDVDVLCETEEEYFRFNWSTTA
jgi:hypothetical protein